MSKPALKRDFERDDEQAVLLPPEVPRRSEILDGPLTRTLIRLAGPAIAAKALHAALGLIDVLWVGRLGAAGSAAVTTSYFATWILTAMVDLTALGILAHVARCVGSGDREQAGHAAAQGLQAGVALGIVIAVAMWFGAPWLFRALGTDAEVTAHGVAYLRIVFLAAPLTFTYLNSEFLMRAAGDTRTPLVVASATVFANASLDPLLIYGFGPVPGLGVRGAGLASLLSQLIACGLFGFFALRRHPSFPLRRSSLGTIDRPLLGSLVRIGLPGMAMGVLYSGIYLFISAIAARLGTRALAIVGLGNRIESVTYLVTNGFGAATATVVGQCLGAKRLDRAERAAWGSATWMVGYAMLTGALMVCWPEPILRLFSSDAAVVVQGAPYVQILGLAQPFMAMEIVLEYAFSGAGDTVPPMAVSVPMNALRIPLLLFLLGRGAGLLEVGWVLSITCMVRGALAGLWFRRGNWKKSAL